jgi:hypothetical protein
MSLYQSRGAMRRERRAGWVLALLLAAVGGSAACRQLYSGPPVVRDSNSDRLVTKVVRAKREPNELIAEDLTVCWVIPEVFAGIRPGDHWRCDWR